MDLLRLFETPVLVVGPDETGLPTHALRDRLVAEAASTHGLRRSNGGAAWHSIPDLALRPDACFQDVIQRVVALSQQLTGDRLGERAPPAGFRASAQAWAIVTRTGGYGVLHDHADAHWSAAYYADAGDDAGDPSGCLALVDPRRASTLISGVELDPTTVLIRPQTGMLVLFPGWLQHFVHPYAGTRPRVVLSVNVHLAAR